MVLFHVALEDRGLIDIGFNEHWFTWEKGNVLETNIREQLDKGLLM